MSRMDWGFTDDGDLALGVPKVNEDGDILYKHLNNQIDTERGEDGKEVRDVDVVEFLEADKQIILNRLKTESPDWYHHPRMGGNLSDLIGEPNTRETGERGAQYIREALTYRGLFSERDVDVRPVPLSPESLLFMITITKSSQVVRLPVSFHLANGLVNYYEVPAT